jgi:glycosyltransferase involved in cell wall biosynthesis
VTHTPELGTLAVVVPALNEESAIGEFIREAEAQLLPIGGLTRLTLVVVDDGSTDSTADVVKDLAAKHHSDTFRIELVRFTRNFGKDAAVYAGVQRAAELAAHIGVMDADLQHPMHVMARMAKIAISGEHHVVGVMTFQKQKPWYSAFKKLLHTLREVASDGATEPQGVGDFRVFSRQIALEFLQLRERARFTRGMFSYLGYPATFVHFDAVAALQPHIVCHHGPCFPRNGPPCAARHVVCGVDGWLVHHRCGCCCVHVGVRRLVRSDVVARCVGRPAGSALAVLYLHCIARHVHPA